MSDPNFRPGAIGATELEKLLRAGLGSGSEVFVKDTQGDGYHFEVVVVSKAFQGLPKVRQHQTVYSLLTEAFQGPLHAVTLKTFTPEDWDKFSG